MKFIFLCSIMLLAGSIFIITNAYGSALAPRHQMNVGIPVDEVVCNEDLVKLFDTAKSRAVCVKDSTADTLIQRGWKQAPITEPQAPELTNTVKTITVSKVEPVGVKKSTTAIYDYVFEVCAGPVTLIAQEVLVKSDIETKRIIMANDVQANSCLISATSVTAVDSSLIRSELIRQDDIISKASSIRAEIDDLTQQIDAEKMSFVAVLLEQDSAEKKEKIGDSIAKINQIRQAIADLKDDLNRYYFVLYGSSKTTSPAKMSFSGSEISDDSVKIVSATPARTEGYSHIVLEVCAGSSALSDPIVVISSDVKQNTLKLTKAIANSCYKTGARTEATSSDSISVKFADVVSTTSPLEDIITNLRAELLQKRAELLDLTQNTVNPDPNQIHQLTNDISLLREEMLKAKEALYQNLYKAYRAT